MVFSELFRSNSGKSAEITRKKAETFLEIMIMIRIRIIITKNDPIVLIVSLKMNWKVLSMI